MTKWSSSMTKEEFIKENNVTNGTLLQVDSQKYQHSGGYYGSSNGWIGTVQLDGYASSDRETKIKLNFKNGDDWNYLPSELRVVTMEDIEKMEDKSKSFNLYCRSTFCKMPSDDKYRIIDLCTMQGIFENWFIEKDGDKEVILNLQFRFSKTSKEPTIMLILLNQ